MFCKAITSQNKQQFPDLLIPCAHYQKYIGCCFFFQTHIEEFLRHA
jgi:hypothetical protein